MCFEYDGYSELCSNRVVVARKSHRCGECNATINSGEEYHHHSGKFDGNFYAEKVCRRCDYDRVRVVEHELAEGCRWGEAWPPLGGLVDYLRDSGIGQTAPDDVPATFRVGDLPREPTAALVTEVR